MKGDSGPVDFFSKTLSSEVGSIDHDSHPDIDLMLAALEGALEPEIRSGLSAHIATCESCRKQWKQLAERLLDAAATQTQRSRVPSLGTYIAQRVPRRAEARSPVADWLRSLFETRVLATAAASAAVLALTLAVGIPLLRGPAVRTSEQLEMLSNRITTLQSQLEEDTPGFQFGNNTLSTGEVARPISAAALNAFDWETLVPYTVKPGDNWEQIAQQKLGSAVLWPLLWYINRESGPPDAQPPVGESVLLPTPRFED